MLITSSMIIIPTATKNLQWQILKPPPGFKPIIRLKIVDDEEDTRIIDIDDENFNNRDGSSPPGLCPSLISDVIENLRISETENRPSPKYMEKIQKHINPRTRMLCVDWLVDVAWKLKLYDDALHLSVNYLDRYLSKNEVKSVTELRLVALTCLRIAWKHEKNSRSPSLETFLFVSGLENLFSQDELIRTERFVLSVLNYEVTVPTALSFLGRFAKARGKGREPDEDLFLGLVNYITELSLLSYDMVRFLPSMVAASSVFLAKYILMPVKKPWNSTLRYYTNYRALDLRDCVSALFGLWWKSSSSRTDNECRPELITRKKYSGKEYEYAALRVCPSSIPREYFQENVIRSRPVPYISRRN